MKCLRSIKKLQKTLVTREINIKSKKKWKRSNKKEKQNQTKKTQIKRTEIFRRKDDDDYDYEDNNDTKMLKWQKNSFLKKQLDFYRDV